MALLATIARHRQTSERLGRALHGLHDVAPAASWSSFVRLVRERPVTVGVVDLGAVAGDALTAVTSFRALYPGTALVLLDSLHRRPADLFRLGRTGVSHLVLWGIEDPAVHLRSAVGAAVRAGVLGRLLRTISGRLPRREAAAVHLALDTVHRAWSADAFATHVGLTRPALSERFRRVGLPPVGHLLMWVRVLYACQWLTDPGRSAESVSRQLEYSTGAAFRRALKLCTNATPTEVIQEGGLDFGVSQFLERTELGSLGDWTSGPGLTYADA